MRSKRNLDLPIKDRPLTTQRRLLLDILHQADTHLDAKELYRRAIEKDRNISLATVYRNLRLFSMQHLRSGD
jgi:Fe2+ or Zn2+ uptake regulation protein